MVAAMWRAKLGFPSVSGDAAETADSLWADVQALHGPEAVLSRGQEFTSFLHASAAAA